MKCLLCLLCVLGCTALAAQKRNNIFLTAEVNRYIKGLSLVYNRALAKTNFGVGAGLEVIDIGQRKLGGLMPVADVRYYANVGRSSFIPLAQAGYNIYHYRSESLNPMFDYTMMGGPGFAFGLGYSYKIQNRGGPFAGLRYTGVRGKLVDSVYPAGRTYTHTTFKLSVGWRF